MLMAIVLTVLAIFGLLVTAEVWWRLRQPDDEISRKFIHIAVGSFAAFWPLYLNWNVILLLSLAFIVVVITSKYLHIFRAIHAVQRPTWGEICFALAVGGLSLITHNRWIYATALLHMSLADGLAAIIGTWLGKTNAYRILGHLKSVVGSLTFMVVSICLLTVFSGHYLHLPVVLILGLALAATAVENVGIYGLDNLLVPVLVGVVLRLSI